MPKGLTYTLPTTISLKAWARQIKRIWQHPIYLVGSGLRKKRPRDWDIRVELPDVKFKKLIGPVKIWESKMLSGDWDRVEYHWSDICVAFNHDGHEKTGLNIDFQFYPLSYAKELYGTEKKLKLA